MSENERTTDEVIVRVMSTEEACAYLAPLEAAERERAAAAARQADDVDAMTAASKASDIIERLQRHGGAKRILNAIASLVDATEKREAAQRDVNSAISSAVHTILEDRDLPF